MIRGSGEGYEFLTSLFGKSQEKIICLVMEGK